MDKIVEPPENREFIIGVFVDFSKAFDMVNHGVVLQNLQHYGIRGFTPVENFQSYHSDIYQYVTDSC